MSYVYKARDIETGKVIVIKHIKKSVLNNVSNLDVLITQIKQFIALNHENIASFYEVSLQDGELFLFCDYLSGENLAILLNKVGKLSLEKCANMFRQIATGLDYAHQNRICHGDLRPSNIFIVNDEFNNDEPKIVDFGIMQLIDKASAENNKRTTTSHPILGQATYMSPEQRLGSNIDARGDLYSLGCLMYEAACGKSPLTSKSAMETTYKQKILNPTNLFDLLPSHPYLEGYQIMTNNLLQADPEKRIKSAQLLVEDLDLLISGNSIVWHKQANVLRKSKYHFLFAHKWHILGASGLLACTLLIIFLSPVLNYYMQPWHTDKIDENRLYLIDDKETEPSTQLKQQIVILQSKVREMSKGPAKSSPLYTKYLVLLAKCFLADSKWEEAKAAFAELQRSGITNESNADFCGDIAICQFKTGNIDAAKQWIDKILTRPPDGQFYVSNKIIALKLLGDIYSQRNELSSAQETYKELYEFTKANRLNKPAEFAYAAAVLADAYRKDKKLSQAESFYKEALDWGENYIGQNRLFIAKISYGLALAYYQQGKYEEARNMLRLALPIVIMNRGLKNDFVSAINQFNDYLLFHQNVFLWSKKHWQNAG